MVTISGDTPDDDLKKPGSPKNRRDDEKEEEEKFIKTFNLPNSQMHYRPDRILELNETEVLLEGVEGSTNMNIRVKMLRGMFDTMIENNPKAKFLINDWWDKTSEKKKQHE